jgi:hypothetical protein
VAGLFTGKRTVHSAYSRQVRTFRDLFLITELLDSKAESDDVGF